MDLGIFFFFLGHGDRNSYDEELGYEIGSSHFLDERHFAVSCLVRFVVLKEREGEV